MFCSREVRERPREGGVGAFVILSLFCLAESDLNAKSRVTAGARWRVPSLLFLFAEAEGRPRRQTSGMRKRLDALGTKGRWIQNPPSNFCYIFFLFFSVIEKLLECSCYFYFELVWDGLLSFLYKFLIKIFSFRLFKVITQLPVLEMLGSLNVVNIQCPRHDTAPTYMV